MKRTVGRIVGLGFLLWMVIYGGSVVQAQERRTDRLMLGVELGPSFGTIDETALSFGFSGDYYTSPNLSVGPLLLLGITDDLTQLAFSGQLKYTFDVPNTSALRPNVQVGLGFIFADHDRCCPSGRDESDTSYLVPAGVGFEYRVQTGLYVGATALMHFTNLENSGGGLWQNSLHLLFGFKVLL